MLDPTMAPPEKTPQQPERARLSVDLSPAVLSLLDHVSTVTGVTRTQLVVQLVVDALPELCARADDIAKRATQLNGARKR